MSPQSLMQQNRLSKITEYLSVAVSVIDQLSDMFATPFLKAISGATGALVDGVQNVKRNHDDCMQMLEHIHVLLHAIIRLHTESETNSIMLPSTLSHIEKFTETLQKIHAFVVAQQDSNKIRIFLRQSETRSLLKDCNAGLAEAFDVFLVRRNVQIFTGITEMKMNSQKNHEELLEMIAALSDRTTSDEGSSVGTEVLSQDSDNSSTNSISLLPSKPSIFHGRDSELQEIVDALMPGPARIAILGAGGMGKSSLSRAVLHHPEITANYKDCFFVPSDSATTSVGLAGVIGSHLGLKPGKDLTKAVIQSLSERPHCLLVLDNLETSWEPAESRAGVEEFLSLLTDVSHLALIITMRGAERPAKVRWTHPFLPPLKPLTMEASRMIFMDIADDIHDDNHIDQLLLLTDRVPLAVNLVAHLVDHQGCPNVLSRWEKEKTSLISNGYDKSSNLDISIQTSLSSTRMASNPAASDLLSLLSILPDGLLDSELCHENHQQILIFAVAKHFYKLLGLYMNLGVISGDEIIANHIASNLGNVQNLLLQGLHSDHPGLRDSIYGVILLNSFSQLTGRGYPPLMNQLPKLLSQLGDHELYNPIHNLEDLLEKAQEHLKKLNDLKIELSSVKFVLQERKYSKRVTPKRFNGLASNGNGQRD
ncbi:P-loop containing nucleoside triphosphate hydrolase protein [Mycena leptocephala]|nr:P-loop containing nucleoside triphosphate hydrolase protein [Mycena leptocephala]